MSRPKGDSAERAENAFQAYLKLGEEKSYQKLADNLSISRTTVQTWALKYKWKERLKKIRQKEKDKVDKIIAETSAQAKARYLKKLIEPIIERAIEKIKNIAIKRPSDIQDLIKTALLLRDQPGEITETRDVKYTAKIDDNDRIDITKSASEAERVH